MSVSRGNNRNKSRYTRYSGLKPSDLNAGDLHLIMRAFDEFKNTGYESMYPLTMDGTRPKYVLKKIEVNSVRALHKYYLESWTKSVENGRNTRHSDSISQEGLKILSEVCHWASIYLLGYDDVPNEDCTRLLEMSKLFSDHCRDQYGVGVQEVGFSYDRIFV